MQPCMLLCYAYFKKSKWRILVSYGGRSNLPADKSQQYLPLVPYVGRSSLPADKSRISMALIEFQGGGRPPAFNYLAAAFENLKRNLPLPSSMKLYTKYLSPDCSNVAPKRALAIVSLLLLWRRLEQIIFFARTTESES